MNWIEASQVPSDDVLVVAFEDERDEHPRVMTAYNEGGKWYNAEMGTILYKVTHWMPIPQLP